jgi:hypothetical protein
MGGGDRKVGADVKSSLVEAEGGQQKRQTEK